MDEASFDYVIVGAGSAGSVLAARLTEDPSVRVLLLEAGGPATGDGVKIPAAFLTLFRTGKDWNYQTEPQKQLHERSLYWPRGKMLGGSSSMNAMIYIRGHRADYDEWRDLGNPGWSYDDVLPYFKRAESNSRGADAYHGADGPLRVEDLRWRSKLGEAFLEAAQQAGHAANPDFNGAEQDGVGPYQVTQRRGERWSTFKAYLEPALPRPNLSVVTHALARRVVFEGRRAVGVEYAHEGAVRTARAEREVLLCGGTINSPHLLLLSGLGPAGHLREHGLEVVEDLPGVGENLQDHLVTGWSHRCPTPDSLFDAESTGNLVRYLARRKGPLTSNVAEVGGFARTEPGLDAPDFQFHFLPTLVVEFGKADPPGHGWSILACVLRPRSRGTIRLRSADPRWAPAIQPNYLDAPEDLDVLERGLEQCQAIAGQRAFERYRGERFQPDETQAGDLREYIREVSETLFHPVGTARMGQDELAAVDAELRVRGVEGLRVVDASIMPTVVRGNTNAPVIMIAERAADLLTARVPAAAS